MTVELSTDETPGNTIESCTESLSARLFQCARCYSLTRICSCCDRGHVYCIDCASPARKEGRQGAAKRYQLSPKGRLHHAARQSRYRERLRLKKEKVTHQGSCDSINVVTAEDLTISKKEHRKTSVLIKNTSTICDYCALVCSPFLRQAFLTPSYRSIRKTNSRLVEKIAPETG